MNKNYIIILKYYLTTKSIYMRIFYFILLLTFTSCTTVKKTEPTEKTAEGFFFGNKAYFSIGDGSSVDVFQSFIQKHNEKDFDGLRELIADSIKISGPKGKYLVGADQHIAYLKEWLSSGEFTWEGVWGAPIKFMGVDDGSSTVISSLNVKMKVADSTSYINDLIVANVKEGKINQFWVHQREYTPTELAQINSVGDGSE
tara:strand:+ start:2979 stop:3578 length:600 start_codon:yes stop_codon:yes gene_type:complete